MSVSPDSAPGWLTRNWKGIIRIGAFAAAAVALLRILLVLLEYFAGPVNGADCEAKRLHLREVIITETRIREISGEP